MARRVFLHVGTPQSGTTFLQSVWWANKGELSRQGLLLPDRGRAFAVELRRALEAAAAPAPQPTPGLLHRLHARLGRRR